MTQVHVKFIDGSIKVFELRNFIPGQAIQLVRSLEHVKAWKLVFV